MKPVFDGDPTDLGAGMPDGPVHEVLVAIVDGRVISRILPADGTLTIGRSSECDVVVDDPSVSRCHLRLQLSPRRTIEDLGSTHGSRLSARPLVAGSPVPLGPGESVTMGRVTVMVQQRSRAPAGPSVPPGSSAMAAVRRLIERVAPGSISVLILGETGVGKDVTAAAIHEASPRRAQPFIKLNCAAFSEQLLESELFGHERGAFTGAVAPKPGLLEAASGGTVFLDEIGEMSLALQAKLLRAVEDNQVRRVGGIETRTIDVRFVSATNRDLETDMTRGGFRRDLYYRLAGASIVIPPLRERIDEIDGLAAHFVARATPAGRPIPRLTDEARRCLREYAWPGNIRELRNVLERAVLFAGDGGEIGRDCLPANVEPSRPSGTSLREEVRREVADLERQRVLEALAECGGNQTRAAKLLGMSRRAFVDRLDAFGVTRPRKDRR